MYRKNVLELANIFSKLPDNNWSLDIYGSGILFKTLQKILKNKKRIHIFGNINNNELVTRILPLYDYLILPSKFEGWGTVVNESLSQGVKVITNNRCGSSTLVKKNILFGHVYNFGQLHDCISNILNTTPSQSEKGRLKISNLYRDKIQYEMIELFKNNLDIK